ncbi:hypothetical protein [Glaciecola sp. 1036]|uniref:hypothetical protein n=1 Tax=Alteromonadaceae TaxID=72275 RepID=UPI003CFD9759
MKRKLSGIFYAILAVTLYIFALAQPHANTQEQPQVVSSVEQTQEHATFVVKN